MALDAHDDGLMPIDGFSINLKGKQRPVKAWFIKEHTGTQEAGLTYSAHSVGIVLLYVGPDGRVHGAPPALHGAVDIMRARVAGLLPQVVKLEGDLVLWVQDPAVPEVTVLCN